MSVKKCPKCGGELLLIETEYPSGKPLKRPYHTCSLCSWSSKGLKRKRARSEDKRKDPSQPSSFTFRHKYTRSFHYIGNDGEPTEIKIPIDLPVEIYTSEHYKILKHPSRLDGKIIIAGPVSGEEITVDWKKALEERIESGEGENKKLSNTVEDDVETYMALVSMWRELNEQIENGSIDAPTAFRKHNVLLHLQEQFPDMTPFVERALKIFEPLTDNRLHGIVVRYGDPNLEETFDRLPTDRKIMSKLGVKSDYGKRVIVRTFGTSVERFLALWKDADETIEALDKFREAEEKRLGSSKPVVKDVALDMVATLKEKVKELKDEQWQWQNNQLNKIWRVMFPTGKRPTSDWERLTSKALGGV